MAKLISLVICFLCTLNLVTAQGKFIIQNKQKSDKIKFKLINNLIVFPLEINGVELSFLLDTGVSKPIIFNFLNVSDTLKIRNTESIYLRGLGEGESVEALKSEKNIMRIGDAINIDQDLYAIYNSNLTFAPRLGIPVHGIIGFDLLKDFVVEVNYSRKFLRITEPSNYVYKDCKNCERVPLEFYNSKPYINAHVTLNSEKIPVKLLIDSGSSDSIWLFENDSLNIRANDKNFYDFLGHGLSGSLYGKRSIIKSFSINDFILKEVNVAFPDSASTILARRIKDRNGSVCGNVLKRFNHIFDYSKAFITLKKNKYFKDKFTYNKSGIELAHSGVRLVKEQEQLIQRGQNSQGGTGNSGTKIVLDRSFKFSLKPAYTIVELRKDSPAYRAGLELGDIVLSINGKAAHNYSLQEIIQMFYDDTGKKIKLRVDRNGIILTYSFQLEDVLK